MQAFAPPCQLRLPKTSPTRCVTRTRPVLTLAENPPAPASGKRVPTFKKLQRRHRQGPSTARRAETEQQQQQEEKEKKAEQTRKQKRRPLSGRPGRPLRDLVIGEALNGFVQNIVPHGAFVDVGASRDGMVHVRDMAIDFVHTPRDVVRSGMKVRVWVKYIDSVRDVLGLTMIKPTMGFEGRTKISDVSVGTRHHGIVERVTNYGAYVDIGAERLAFLHVSGVWGENPRETMEYMRLGDQVWVHVIGVDETKGHLRLFARGKDHERLTKDLELDSNALAPTIAPDENVSDFAIARPWDAEENDDTEDSEDTHEVEGEEQDDKWDEFDFVNEGDDHKETIRFEDIEQVGHMFSGDTEFVDVSIDET